MGNHIFICYARKDTRFVLRLATRLKERGVPIWLDQWDIPPGVDWDQYIDSALHSCAKFLIVLSPVSVASNEVRGELRWALNKSKPIVPVLYQACDIPRRLELTQHVDFTGRTPDDETALSRLICALDTPEPEEDFLVRKYECLPSDPRRLWLYRVFNRIRQFDVAGNKVVLRCLRLYGMVGCVFVLGLLIVWVWLSSPQPKLEPPKPPGPVLQAPALRKVPVSISTQPSKFQVYRDGNLVGTTPWESKEEVVGSIIKVVLKREGFKEQEITFRVQEHGNWYVYTPEKSSGR
jgi:hypothetical protein